MNNPSMIFRRFTVGSYPINGYLIGDVRSRLAAFIDPGGFSDEIAAFISQHNLDLRHILFTHGHWDHTDGLPRFRELYSVQCHAGPNEVAAASNILHGSEQIDLGSLHFSTLSTPGHTTGGISYYCQDRVFTGDALFCGSVGGTSSADAADRQLQAVRRHIFSLPDETLVFPAHGPPSTVAAEKYANPFFD